jgi:hypothetical protein
MATPNRTTLEGKTDAGSWDGAISDIVAAAPGMAARN